MSFEYISHVTIWVHVKITLTTWRSVFLKKNVFSNLFKKKIFWAYMVFIRQWQYIAISTFTVSTAVVVSPYPLIRAFQTFVFDFLTGDRWIVYFCGSLLFSFLPRQPCLQDWYDLQLFYFFLFSPCFLFSCTNPSYCSHSVFSTFFSHFCFFFTLLSRSFSVSPKISSFLFLPNRLFLHNFLTF